MGGTDQVPRCRSCPSPTAEDGGASSSRWSSSVRSFLRCVDLPPDDVRDCEGEAGDGGAGSTREGGWATGVVGGRWLPSDQPPGASGGGDAFAFASCHRFSSSPRPQRKPEARSEGVQSIPFASWASPFLLPWSAERSSGRGERCAIEGGGEAEEAEGGGGSGTQKDRKGLDASEEGRGGHVVRPSV